MLIFLELGLFLSMHDKSEFEQDYGVFAEDGETLPHGHLKGRGWVKTNISPRRGQDRDVELGSHSWMDCLAAELFLSSGFLDIVFVTLFRTAVEAAVSGVHKLVHTGGVPTSLTLLFWW